MFITIRMHSQYKEQMKKC